LNDLKTILNKAISGQDVSTLHSGPDMAFYYLPVIIDPAINGKAMIRSSIYRVDATGAINRNRICTIYGSRNRILSFSEEPQRAEHIGSQPIHKSISGTEVL
jgi:hypothetical protein